MKLEGSKLGIVYEISSDVAVSDVMIHAIRSFTGVITASVCIHNIKSIKVTCESPEVFAGLLEMSIGS